MKNAGLLTKCDRIITALTFFKKEVVPPSDAVRRTEVEAMVDRVDGWRKTYRKAKKQAETHSTAASLDAEEAGDGRTMEEMESVLQCQDLWQDFDRACEDVEEDVDVDNKTLSLMTGAIGTRLMFDSVQRPGAVIGLRVSEYRRGREVEGLWVVTVRDHKTSRDGPARLTLTAETKEYVDRYVRTLRLVLDPLDKVDNLLVLPGGRPVSNMNHLMAKLSKMYSIFIPTATELRKKTATMCAVRGTAADVRLLSNQMSHSASTHRRHYEELGTATHAAQAHKVAKSLTGKTKGKRARYPFSEEETRAVHKFFFAEIEQSKSASLEDCRRYLKRHPNPHNRTPKNIQDKVKSIVKYKQ